MRILFAEDRAALRRALAEAMERAGFDVLQAPEGAAAMELIKEGDYSCAIFDLKMPVHNGLELLKASLSLHPGVPVILLTAYSSVGTAVSAMRDGAFTYLEKPINASQLIDEVNRALRNSRRELDSEAASDEPGRSPAFREIRGNSDLINNVRVKAARIAVTDTTCMLLGETGVGKELFARAIHEASPRRDGHFVPVNCAAIPETLLENELFGHEKGAFTGAGDRALGKFEYANGGTIFLDEIGDMGISLQAKLLRVLEERRFTRIGGTKPISVDVRLLCATNRDLGAMVENNAFRGDLFYRLNVFPIRIPPLRERREDIPLLAEYFVERFRVELGLPKLSVTQEGLEWLCQQPWPGNVRQFMNDINRAAILVGDGGIIDSELLKREPRPGVDGGFDVDFLDGLADPATWLEAEEVWRVKEVLARCGGDFDRAAEVLGMPKNRVRTLSRDGKKHPKETPSPPTT